MPDPVFKLMEIRLPQDNETTLESMSSLLSNFTQFTRQNFWDKLIGKKPTIASLEAELTAAAGKRGVAPMLDIRFVPGALEALNAGDGARHDALLAAAAAALPDVDVLLLAQFSMVGAGNAVAAKAGGRPVLTAPDEAVGKLRSLLD